MGDDNPRVPPDRKFDGVVLTGGRKTNIAKSLPNKNFLKIKRLPLFIHALKAVSKVKRIDTIYIVGPREKINRKLEKRRDAGLPINRIKVLQETSSVVENIWIAFLDSLKNVKPNARLEHSGPEERAIFVIGGDSPLVIPEEIDQFLDGCDLAKYDYFMGMTPASALNYYRPKMGKRGVRLTYTDFAEDLLRINNMHLVKPLRIEYRREFQELYNMRSMKKLTNVIRCGYGLVKRNIGIRDWLAWAGMMAAMFFRGRGMSFISDYIRKGLYMERAEKVAGNLLGARAHIVVTTFGGAAIDVDRRSNIKAIERNYEEWIAHQKGMI